MRKLIIKRNKTFVASLAKLKIYKQDDHLKELVICGDNCVKLGEIKNGEEKAFEITNEQTKIYAIWDKTSKDYCNDMYLIPEGENDFYLYGKAQMNSLKGNPFRFENNNTNAAELNRKKTGAKANIVSVIAIILGLIVGFILATAFLNF